MVIWLLFALLFLCSGTVSGAETALFGLTPQELRRFAGPVGVLRRRVHRLMRDPRRVLTTVLIANTACNVAIFAISFVALGRLHDNPILATAGGVAVLLGVVIFGEMLPKGIALAARVRLAPAAAEQNAAIR